jgi:hypothetical protein
MTMRIPWDRYEVALLFSAYERVAGGSDIHTEATKLSETLRNLATRRGVWVDETYRNVNGMKMQLANVQYLFTDGRKGLSGASAMIRRTYELYKSNQMEYQTILKEAIRMTGTTAMSIEDAFFVYATNRTNLSPKILAAFLKKAEEYCHLKQPLLGMTDVKAVRNVLQKISEGKLLRFRFGKDAQTIRSATHLYYAFVKSHRGPKEEPTTQEVLLAEKPVAEQALPAAKETVVETVSKAPAVAVEDTADGTYEPEITVSYEDAAGELSDDQLWVDFSQDNSYLFTKPISYTYKGEFYDAKSWNRLYVEICGLLFTDYRDAFMGIMNGDIPGYNALAFADDQHYHRMRAPKSFAPGYYLESNLDATSIVRKLRGLHQLFSVGSDLKIAYQSVEDRQPSQPKEHREIDATGQLTVSTDYDWQREDLLLVDLKQESSYAFTQPEAYEYNGVTKRANKWGKLYADLCGSLFNDYHDDFMGIMNGDIPGYNTLAFADEQHKSGMRVARQFAPGYYLESNMDATTIVRKIRGLHRLFRIGDTLRISYQKIDDKYSVTREKAHTEEWIIAQLKAKGFTYQDKRAWNGCLWIVGEHDLDSFAQECKAKGYILTFKEDGCKTYPNQPVWWTRDSVEQQIDTSGFRRKLDKGFKPFLIADRQLSERTAAQYSQSIQAVEQFLLDKGLNCTFDVSDPDEAQRIYNMLMARNDFVIWNNQRHHQYSAALAQYVGYLRQDETYIEAPEASNRMTIKDVTIKVLKEAGEPLTMPEIMRRIEVQQLYRFNSNNPLQILYQGISKYCKGMKAPHHASENVFDRFPDENGQIRYIVIGEGQSLGGSSKTRFASPADERWQPILQDSFPDGYILNDFLSQFQAGAFWQERYAEACPIEGAAIDEAMKAIGTVRDGRIFVKSEESSQLISAICAEINDILSRFTAVCRISIYERYREQLATCQIYTEQVMTQQLLDVAKGSFYLVNQFFAKSGQYASVTQDCRKVLRNHGGAMSVSDVAKELWFIPYDMVYRYLTLDDEALNIGNSEWMLAEHFPLTKEDAAKVGDMLDKYFLSQDFVQAAALMPLMKQHLPSIATDLFGLHFTAIFNILNYHLKNCFSFSRSIITPKGTKTDFRALFRGFAKEHKHFTLDELAAFASELQVPIYWENTFMGGAVRVSKTEFVHRSQITFDTEATDAVLESFCSGDYLPLQAVSSALMMHLPPCGYYWNGYLLLSYVHSFSKAFRLLYNSFAMTGYYGAIVRRSCKKIDCYERLVEQVLTDDDSWQTEDEALGLLVSKGLQAQRRLKKIGQLVAKARQNKLSDDGR